MNPNWSNAVRAFFITARRGVKIRWGRIELLIVVLLLAAILCLASSLISTWFQASPASGIIQVSLLAISSADYSVDDKPRSIPVIGLEIIRDILSQDGRSSNSEPSSASAFIPGSQTPTPTAVRAGEIISTTAPADLPGESPPNENRATATNTSIPQITSTLPPLDSDQTPTRSPSSSSTPTPSRTPMPSSTPPGSSPLPSSTAPAPTGTQPPLVSTPTPLPQPSATNTPLPNPTQQPTPTSPPASSPTPQPTPRPTSPPTRSPTLVVTPTSLYTPIVTGFPYP